MSRARVPPLQLPTTTLSIYAHLFADDHSDAMAALGALATGPTPSYSGNVVPLHG